MSNTPQDRSLVTRSGFAALVGRARRKRVKVKGQQGKGGGRMQKSNRVDQVNADTEQIEITADQEEARLLEAVIGDVAVVIPGDNQDKVAEGDFVTLCIECDDKPDMQSTWLLYQSRISVVESHHGVMDPSSDIGRAVLGQLVGKELRVSTRGNGDRAVEIISSQKPTEVSKPKVRF